jgi:hypothetical protein
MHFHLLAWTSENNINVVFWDGSNISAIQYIILKF